MGAVEECVEVAKAVLGEENTVQADKVNCWEVRLEGIGWKLNLETWAVLPKEKGLAKLMVVLFETVPIGCEWVLERDMEKLQVLGGPMVCSGYTPRISVCIVIVCVPKDIQCQR